MTSFEQPESELLVEHLLPALIGVSYNLSQDIQDRTLFFGELATALEVLRGRLTVISSPPRVARESSQYPWLWRYVGHFIVGAMSPAVQHAKLWAFHWVVNDQAYLDLHVGSTNLTTPAFKSQIQAGWQVRLPLGKRVSEKSRRTWGNLIPFLKALGVSAGEVAETRIQRLVTLLGHVACPAHITFVASIPSQRSPARQFKQYELSELHILTPTIGEWEGSTLPEWCSDAGVVPGKIHLKWISQQHKWVEPNGWALSTGAHERLERHGVQLECLPADVRLTEQHQNDDFRWSHAKLYLLRSGRKRRLLVTSANWSVAAWGTKKAAPRNFELGVLFETEWTELERLGEPFDPPETIPFCIERTAKEDSEPALGWAEASWDGKRIRLSARSSTTHPPIVALVTFAGNAEESVTLVDDAAYMPWEDSGHTPLTAQFTQETAVLVVNVIDLRRPAAFAETPLPEVDPTVAKTLREAFLLQRYGGPLPGPENIPGLNGADRPPGLGAPSTDYSVQAWLDARAAFNVVDKWRAALTDAAGDPVLKELVRLDGQDLHSLYARRRGPAAGLVADELSWRLDEDT